MRIAMILALTMMGAACSQRTTPTESSATSSGNSLPSDSNLVVTTTTEHVGATQLRQSFLSGDMAQVANDTNEMLTSRDAAALSYLQAVWSFDPKIVSELDGAFIHSPSIRAYMANVLAQTVGNGMFNIDLAPLREALRAGLLVQDRDVKIISTDGLSYIAEAADVDRFMALAEATDVALAKVAVAALASACGQYASEKLDGFISQAKNQEVKQVAESMRIQLKDATAARCTGK